MNYEMEELVPIVARLAEKYTSKESTSITYDKASMLMEAVLYSIHELEICEQFSLVSNVDLSPEEMYAAGVIRVKEKTKESLNMYNDLMTHFSSYENRCLHNTVVKGIPEFFKWYDCIYEPQNTILTLDYPVLIDIPEYTGIDKIYDFIVCIQLEQKFLNSFPSEYIRGILSKYDKHHTLMIENICEIVLMNVIIHIMTGKELSILNFEPAEYKIMQTLIQRESLEDLQKKLKSAANRFVNERFENDEMLVEYLYRAVDNISVRIKNAADYGNLNCII